MNDALHVNFNGIDCIVKFGKYANNGNTAIFLSDATSMEPVLRASVNLVGEDIPANFVFIKDYSENTGILKVLENAGIVKRTGRVVPTGYVTVPEAKILVDF